MEADEFPDSLQSENGRGETERGKGFFLETGRRKKIALDRWWTSPGYGRMPWGKEGESHYAGETAGSAKASSYSDPTEVTCGQLLGMTAKKFGSASRFTLTKKVCTSPKVFDTGRSTHAKQQTA